MTLTRWRTLALLALLTGVLGWLLAQLAYGDLVTLPAYAALTAGVLAAFEAILARTVADRVRGRRIAPGVRSPRPMHPLQVVRALALAKASSAAGALLFGLYGGLAVWTFPRRDRLVAAAEDTQVAVLSALACLLLVGAAMALERACRTPDPGESG